MALGTVTLEFMIKEKLWEQVYTKGEHFTSKLKEFQKTVDFIGDVRGRGLMIGIEVINPTLPSVLGFPAHWGELAALIQKKCIQNGLMIEKGGRFSCVLRFLPPLIISLEQLNDALSIFFKSSKEARAQILSSSKI